MNQFRFFLNTLQAKCGFAHADSGLLNQQPMQDSSYDSINAFKTQKVATVNSPSQPQWVLEHNPT